MPRVIGCLSWYLERASMLHDAISSYIEAGVTHLVAVDGAYAWFPDGTPRSNGDERDRIIDTCSEHRIPLLLIEPRDVWAGGEVEKRTTMFREAEKLAQPNEDWYVIIDADEIVTRAYDDWLPTLIDSGRDAADVLMWERESHDTPARAQVAKQFSYDPRTAVPIRKIFRAIPGMYCDTNHYTYRTPDGRTLWSANRMEPGCDLTHHIVIQHRPKDRSLHRDEQKIAGYQRRDALGVERKAEAR